MNRSLGFKIDTHPPSGWFSHYKKKGGVTRLSVFIYLTDIFIKIVSFFKKLNIFSSFLFGRKEMLFMC